jgi:hypothetical protein
MPLPSPAVVQRERALRKTLQAMTASYPGVRIAFADCSSAQCMGRVQSSEAAAIDRFASDLRRAPSRFTVRVRERLTGFNGRVFEVDLIEPDETGNTSGTGQQ